MIDDDVVVAVERLQDDLEDLRTALRNQYSANSQVKSPELRTRAARVAEAWMVGLGTRDDIRACTQSDYLADLNIQFQRLLTASEHATLRRKYDECIRTVLSRYAIDLIIPLKQARGRTPLARPSATAALVDPLLKTAFVGHSFAPADKVVADCVVQTLTAIGISAVTGERPKADRISEKVKRLLDDQSLFVGVFTRRDKIARKHEWTTTTWVVDEKAYAVGKGKTLLLLKEEGVGSIGGIHGDYEFIEFSRTRLEELPITILQVFHVVATGLKR